MRSSRDLPPTAGQQRIRISAVSPAGQRRRTQAQRRSACCCGAMLLVCLLIVILAFRGLIGRIFARKPHEESRQVLFPLDVETGGSAYYRFDLIPVTVRVVDPQGNALSDVPPEVVVTHNDEAVKTIGHYGARVRLSWSQDAQAWTGWWPPPWNPDPGRYEIEARTAIDPAEWSWEGTGGDDEEGEPEVEGEAYAVSLAPFELQARERPEMQPGLCVATWEFDFRESCVGPDGTRGDWRTLFDWVEYIGADALWFRGGVTDPPAAGLTLDRPFRPVNLEAIPKLGEEAHRRGLKFGVWAIAYATYPSEDESKNPDYDYSLDISRSTGQSRETDFISLLDDRRVQHLADFFRMVQESEHVDMVGLDYIRTNPGSGGYELTEPFTSQMPVELPDDWASMSERQRQRFVALKIEEQWRGHQDPDFYEAWNWWRAHLGADVVHRIIEQSGIEKPTWIFILSWKHGIQHGQDPIMFTDAGITMLAPMLYQVDDRHHFNIMVRDWNNYLREGQVNLVPGDQVDFHWHQEMEYAPAPAELYDRMVTAHRQYSPGQGTAGAFWHDINRAADPANLGPYNGREWALAGAAAFSTIRDTWDVYPLHCELDAPDGAPIANAFTVKVRLQNVAKRPVTGVRISLCDTPHMVGPGLTEAARGDTAPDEAFGEPYTEVGTVPAGETVEVQVQVRITQADAARLNETMLALRVTWDEGRFEAPVRSELPRVIVLMKYIKGR